ncbi:hypothetical protein QEZ54_18910 [Catellatospora sp. KI3]|uniref:hypothetical protein n=1 Tax=Catellatospora sp. KI3 TaxID=3041620 RepID=UPI0024830693|nr:hypothetical protein [Catellatospora sp. KI3]MDI1463051.1 hypothetical protein [Catellatospora sp. KI3]
MSDLLARRYERLLALYPAAHRAEYGDEMIGVLLAGARPGQRVPGIRETVNLLFCAVSLRLGSRGTRPVAAAVNRSWRTSAGVFGLVGAMVLAALQLRDVQWVWFGGPILQARAPMEWVLVLGWPVVALAAFARLRVPAALAAWAVVLWQLAELPRSVAEPSTVLLERWWTLVLAVGTAVALTLRGTTGGRTVLGSARACVVAAALLVLGFLPLLEDMLREPPEGKAIFFDGAPGKVVYYEDTVYASSEWLRRLGIGGPVSAVLTPVCVLVVVVCLAGLAAGVRRRFAVLAVPNLLTMFAVPWLVDDVMFAPVPMGSAQALRPDQWLVVFGLPLLSLAAGVLLVRRAERSGAAGDSGDLPEAGAGVSAVG